MLLIIKIYKMGLESTLLFITYDNVKVYNLYQPLYVCPSKVNIHYNVSEKLDTVCLYDFWAKNSLPNTCDYNFFFSKKERDKWIYENCSSDKNE